LTICNHCCLIIYIAKYIRSLIETAKEAMLHPGFFEPKTLIDSDLQEKAAYSNNERLLSEVSVIITKLKECVK